MRGGEAGPGSAVVGDLGGVAHEEGDAGGVDAELFGDGLGEERARALAHFDFAGEEGDGAVVGEVEAGGGGVLGGGVIGEEDAGAEDAEEIAAVEGEGGCAVRGFGFVAVAAAEVVRHGWASFARRGGRLR